MGRLFRRTAPAIEALADDGEPWHGSEPVGASEAGTAVIRRLPRGR